VFFHCTFYSRHVQPQVDEIVRLLSDDLLHLDQGELLANLMGDFEAHARGQLCHRIFGCGTRLWRILLGPIHS
jgi:hypothetical protein